MGLPPGPVGPATLILRYSEKVKLTAGWCNTFGLGVSGAGFVALLANADWLMVNKIIVGSLMHGNHWVASDRSCQLEDLR